MPREHLKIHSEKFSVSAAATRHGEYFFKKYGLTNTSSPAYTDLTIDDGTTSVELPTYVAKTPEAITHDADGNLTSDDRWDYTYDAENRLIEMVADASVIPVANKQKLVFTYDYLGRRVQKITSIRNVGDTAWVEDTNTKYAYQGWNLIAEMDGTTITKNYFWGLDLSGTSQGAGGVGGLLMIQDGGDTLLPAYDAMGNLHALMTTASATINGTSYSAGDMVAAYEYDAFGKTLRETGAYAADNPFRFSTKYTDNETGLVYYGKRYYSPSLGRFINRDPIEEQGGINLYTFVGNNAINAWDYLGMKDSAAINDPHKGPHSTPPPPDEDVIILTPFEATSGDFFNFSDDFQFDLSNELALEYAIEIFLGGALLDFGPADGGGNGNTAPKKAEDPKNTLNDCYSAARAAHSADTQKLGQIGDARVESFFGSLAAQRSAARAAMGEAIARTVRNTAGSIVGSYVVGAAASSQWASAAAAGRNLYSAARSWQQINVIATEVASLQATANIVGGVSGTVFGIGSSVLMADNGNDAALAGGCWGYRLRRR